MLLSIIIPAYNLEKYIKQCLDSIIKQISKKENYQIEIIIVNDGSKDSTEQICKEYEEKYSFIKYFYQENKGVSAARNKRIRNVRWKIYFFYRWR